MCNLKTHFSRKKPCRDSKHCGKSLEQLRNEMNDNFIFECICGERYGTQQGLGQHKKHCSMVPKPDDQIKSLMEENSKLQNQINELRNALESSKTPQSVTNVTNNHITNNVTNNISIVYDFGNEDISYVTQDKLFIQDCLKKLTTSAIESIVRKIYFDPSYTRTCQLCYTFCFSNL